MDPRGFPTTLPEFQRVFPDDRACATYLERLRWPEQFACPKCGVVGEPYRFGARPHVLRCRSCKADVSLLAGTVMQSSHTPLSTWFWGAYLVTTQTPGQSALQFQRQLGLTRYETAYMILQKLRSGMVNRRFYPMTAFNSVLGVGVKTNSGPSPPACTSAPSPRARGAWVRARSRTR